MEALSLNKALELYEILGPHIPEIDENDDIDALKFIGKIVTNIKASEDLAAYSLSIELMTGKTPQDLQEMSSEERVELFTLYLMQNRILTLKSFCEELGFKHG
jgi:hypothetical protein